MEPNHFQFSRSNAREKYLYTKYSPIRTATKDRTQERPITRPRRRVRATFTVLLRIKSIPERSIYGAPITTDNYLRPISKPLSIRIDAPKYTISRTNHFIISLDIIFALTSFKYLRIPTISLSKHDPLNHRMFLKVSRLSTNSRTPRTQRLTTARLFLARSQRDG